MAESWYTIADLKEQVEDLLQLHLTEITLMVSGTVLQDDRTLSAYDIQESTTLDLNVIRKPLLSPMDGKCDQFSYPHIFRCIIKSV